MKIKAIVTIKQKFKKLKFKKPFRKMSNKRKNREVKEDREEDSEDIKTAKRLKHDDSQANNEKNDSGYGEKEITEKSSKTEEINIDYIDSDSKILSQNKNDTIDLEKTKQEIERRDEYIKQLEKEREEVSNLKNELNEKENRINELESELLKEKAQQKENYEKNTNNLEQTTDQDQNKEMIDALQQKLNEKDDEFRKLEEKNTELRKEASKYQSALGSATNIRLGDEDSVKFRSDILDLHKTLESYVTNLKPNMDLDLEKIQDLAQQYGCLTPVNNKNKPFIKALLQRKVLDDILNFSKESNNKGEDVKLEIGIETKANELLTLIENFSSCRSGTDEIVKVAAIKVRQQVYGILGNRGFADVMGPDGNHVHDFIIFVSNNLNDTINQYRKINDSNKKKEVDTIAPKLIRDIYTLFFYRLNVQEPKVQYKFCESGSKIDPSTMKGRWDDDDIDSLCVDICSFPLIGRDLDSPNLKTYAPAKVFPRASSETG
ncbi:hypothetical protein C1645_789112, partial [Glomus cerebriforme]